MLKNRDDFNAATKLAIAQRVGYCCSYPACPNKTIGPHHSNPEKSVNVGVAAHVHAASPLGPRYLESMTKEERSAAENGIWLCSSHAHLIDIDAITYSAPLLKEWKAAAEAKANQEIQAIQQHIVEGQETLICLDIDLMFTGVWLSQKDETWTIKVKDFLFGNKERLRSYGNNELEPMRRYIIIESQNEGRLLKEGFEWYLEKSDYILTLQVFPAGKKIPLEKLGGDLAHAYGGDLLIENGDFNMVTGEALARQNIERNLGLPFGGWIVNPLMGSYFSMYYRQYRGNVNLLNRLVKIELLRLMTIPTYQTEHDLDAPLNFIKKIKEVAILEEFDGLVPIFLSLEWSDGKPWSDTLYVRLYDPEKEEDTWEPPEEIKALFSPPPLEQLRKVANLFKVPALEKTKDNETVFRVFNELLPAVYEAAKPALETDLFPLFNKYEYLRSIDGQTNYLTSYDLEAAIYNRPVYSVGHHLYLRGFKNAGVDAFDIYGDLFVYFEQYHFAIGGQNHQAWYKKLYGTQWSEQDVKAIAAKWVNRIAASTAAQIKALAAKKS